MSGSRKVTEKMKISEAIKRLTEFQKEVGDVDLVMVTDVDGAFIVEDRLLEIVEIPTETGAMEAVAAFIDPDVLNGSDNSQLRIVKNDN